MNGDALDQAADPLAPLRAALALPDPDTCRELAGMALRRLALADNELTLSRARHMITAARAFTAPEVVTLVREARRDYAAERAADTADAEQEARSAPPLELGVTSGTWRASRGNAIWPRGGYRLEGDRWRWYFDLPYCHARIIHRDGSGRRSGTSYLLSAAEDGPRHPMDADKIADGTWAAELGVPLPRERKLVDAAGAAILAEAHVPEVPDLEAIARADHSTIAAPPLECLPPGYFRRAPLELGEALECWREIACEATPCLACLLGASVFGPYIGPLRVQSHIVDCCGDPEQGKTTVLRTAAAIWGDSRGEGGTMSAWDKTPHGLIRRLGRLGVLPAFLDEGGMSGYTRQQWATLIFRATNGAQREVAERRGTGTTLSLPWHGVLMMTGNGRITEGLGAGSEAGVIRRVLEIDGPFTEDADQADRLAELAARAYGHPGAELLARFTLGDAAAALERVAAARLEDGSPLVPMPETSGAPRTWAAELRAHVAGAAMLGELLGFGDMLRDRAAEYARDYLAEARPPSHDADRLHAAVIESLAREPSRWPTVAEYREHQRPREWRPDRDSDAEPSRLPQYGIARDYLGVQADDHSWAAMFDEHFGELRDRLSITEAAALRELHRRGGLLVPDSLRRRGEWKTPIRLHPAPARKLPMMKFAVPEDDAEGQSAELEDAPDAESQAAAAAPLESDSEPPTRATFGGEIPQPPQPPQVTRRVGTPTTTPTTPQPHPNHTAAGPPGATRAYGSRDAITVLMAHGRRVALRDGAYYVDGEHASPEALEQLAAELEPQPPAADPEPATRPARPAPASSARTAPRAPAYLVLGGDGRAYTQGGEVLTLPRPLEQFGHVGELAALALELGTPRLWVPRPARELLRLPATLPALGKREGVPHRFTEAADPAAWDVWPDQPGGLAGWMQVYRMPSTLHEGAALAFPEWLPGIGDGPQFADLPPAELAAALELIWQATTYPGRDGRTGGVHYARSPGATMRRLLGTSARRRRSGPLEAAKMPAPFTRGPGSALARVPGLHMAPPAEVPPGYLLARLDVRSCFLAAANGTDFGVGEFEHVRGRKLDATPGIHLLRAAPSASAHPALWPLLPPARRREAEVTAWVDTVGVRWLADRGVPFTVAESYVWPEPHGRRVFASIADRLGPALEALGARGDAPAQVAAAVVKAMYARVFGGWLASSFGGERDPDDPWYNPAWWLTIRVQAEMRKQRNLWPGLASGALLVLGSADIDSVLVAAPSRAALEAAPGTGGKPALGPGRGKFKLEAAATVTPGLAAELAGRASPRKRLAAIRDTLAEQPATPDGGPADA